MVAFSTFLIEKQADENLTGAWTYLQAPEVMTNNAISLVGYLGTNRPPVLCHRRRRYP